MALSGSAFSLLVVLLSIFCRPAAAGQVNRTETGSSSQQEEYNENWNSHIDNQAYLDQLRRQRESGFSPPPVIIIDRAREQRSPSRRYYCPYDDCGDSWGIEYHDQNSSIIYRENYRINPHPPILLRPEPRRYKYRYRDTDRR